MAVILLHELRRGKGNSYKSRRSYAVLLLQEKEKREKREQIKTNRKIKQKKEKN